MFFSLSESLVSTDGANDLCRIYKDKYMDDADDDRIGRLSRSGTDEKKRSKSRSRFFARKKSTAS